MDVHTAQPPRIVVLSDGAPNVFDGAWPDRTLQAISRAELHAYEVASPKAQTLVVSGGGYVKLMHDREGVDVALWLNQQGYSAYLLVHRLPGTDGPAGTWPKDIGLSDALLALDRIELDVPLFIMGLSSGGHLAGVIACQPQVRASGLLMAYSPINANHIDYKAPAGKPDYLPVQKQDFYNDWPIGIAAEPHGLPNCPVFLAYALHDTPVPIEHAINLIMAARERGLDVDAHIYGRAPHGFALRETDGTHGGWAKLAVDWIEHKRKSPVL